MPPDAPPGKHFSVVHWHPDYARDYPKGMGRVPQLLEKEEAARYRMITAGQVITPHLMNGLRKNRLLTIPLIRGMVVSRDV